MFRSKEMRENVYVIYDEVVGSWPANYSEKMIDTPYGKTYAVTIGNEHPITLVLLHGMLVNSCMWNPLVHHFSKNYNLVILDIPLEPGKSEPSKLYRKNGDGPKWLKSVIEELELESVNIVGGSLGGWIGLKFAEDNPEIIRSLTIVSPHPMRGPVIRSAKTWLIAWYALLLTIFRKSKYAEKMLDELYSPVSTPNELDYKLFSTTILASKMRTAPSGMSAKFLSNISCPTFLIVGDSDTNFDKAKLEQCVKFMPNSQYDIVDNAGHMLPCEKPEHVAKKVDDFLCSVT